MRPLEALGPRDVAGIEAVVFDLDDTVLDHGKLGEAAYRALFRLRAAGLELVASTGRSAGFAEVVARRWPVAAAIAENGALAWLASDGGAVELVDSASPRERDESTRRLREVVASIRERYPELPLADDNRGRISDATFDIGEHHRAPPGLVAAAVAHARSLGARSFTSSIHMHVTFDAFDKASGYVRLAMDRGLDPVRALGRAAFVGDSSNDAPAFAAFRLTFGVANVRPFLSKLTVPPGFVADAPMGEGFARIAQALVHARAVGSEPPRPSRPG